jgi:hypothetical protein
MTKQNGTAPKIEPFKVVCQIVGCIKDEKGNIVQEVSLNSDSQGTPVQIVLYASQFDQLEERVVELVSQATTQSLAMQEG